MALELKEKFDSITSYKEHKNIIAQKLVNLPTFISQPSEHEFWLKDDAFAGAWEFDVRIFLLNEEIFIEVSTFYKAFTRDVYSFHRYMQAQTPCQLLDDDDEVYDFDNGL
jgi:hypothetical protein